MVSGGATFGTVVGMRTITAEAMWNIPRVGSPLLSDRWLIVPVTTWDAESSTSSTRLWRSDGAGLRPLTAPGASNPALSPDGGRVAFVRSRDGRKQVHVMHTDGGEPRPIPEVDGSAMGAKWSPDGRRLYVLSSVGAEDEDGVHISDHAFYRYWDRWLTDGSRPHLFEVEIDAWTTRDLTPEQDKWMRWDNTGDPIADIAVSADHLVYCALRPEPPYRDLRWSVYAIDLSTGEERELTPWLDGHASSPRFAPDGTVTIGLQFEPEYYADPVRLASLGLDGDHRLLDLGEWNRSATAWEWQDRRLLLVAEDRGTVRLYSWEGSGLPAALTAGGSVNGFDHTSDRIVVTHASLTNPPEVYEVHPHGLERLTRFTVDAMEDIVMPEVAEITVTGADDAPIQVWLVSSEAGEPRPLVHMIHGGPHGIFGDQWHWRWNAAVFAGDRYTVALANFAGSTSFGDEFARSIHGAWGDRPAADIEAVTDHLVEAGVADPLRMAITGGSYGGYLVSWLITQTNRYRCAVAHAAVTDLPGMYASDITMGRSLAYGAEAWQDTERVQRWSPMSHGRGIETPTLVIHGDLDFRVPVGQGLELYGMLHAKDVPTRLVHFEEEGHWVLDRDRSLLWYREIGDWLERWLES
jgi:dipeptidyl aminopeptidase/acylaminoacyl peptidase